MRSDTHERVADGTAAGGPFGPEVVDTGMAMRRDAQWSGRWELARRGENRR